MKGIADKLKKRFMRHFKIRERVGQQTYRLLWSEIWKFHTVFHISLLERWNTADLQAKEDVPAQEFHVKEQYHEIEEPL